MSLGKAGLMVAAGLGGVAPLCPPCGEAIQAATRHGPAATLVADTATVRLHISGMTCGGCATTARLALKRLTGIYDATVTVEDSLGVVRYDPLTVSPEEIVAHLAKLTGYKATVLADPPKPEGHNS
ncbi:MAG TPA: heavy metal-associated domain-containing protein [Gemmatimonadales bacterium]|nr:heavy metal-associated domain-containing protein [Gemmatimonadales bacterium]